ncbi:MAG: DUF1343 domain-containing protein [Firmicutes bacterium]|nr:DUF1343 domain-containing protein [Bacillota bacterium]
MVRLGIDQIGERESLFKGKRIGLITNYSGVDSRLIDDTTCFMEAGLNVCKLFTPEHGLYGAMDGASVTDSVHPKYKIPMISLYGGKLKPDTEDLQDLDLLVYDIQDVGMRYYTYIYTLANCMMAAGEAGLPLMVLDRPDPLGDTVSGNRMNPAYDCFVGAHQLATRYGLTAGEVGRYFKHHLDLDIDYQVIPMKGYYSSMKWPKTGQLWNLPSPSIHTFHSALCYVGGCFFEATNISEGRGTAAPFQIYGAPFVNMDDLFAVLKERIHDPNLAFRTRAFTPFWSKHQGKTCFGVEFILLSDELDFMPTALVLMKTLLDMYPDQFEFRSYADVSRLTSLSGDTSCDDYLQGKISLKELMESWDAQAGEFEEEVRPFRLYSKEDPNQ